MEAFGAVFVGNEVEFIIEAVVGPVGVFDTG